MKYFLTGLLFLLTSLSACISYAQSDTTFFDNEWHKTTKEHASYFRLTQTQQKSGLYGIEDHYIDGRIQMISSLSNPAKDKLEGYSIYYDSTGHKEEEGNYITGAKTGTWKFYYYGCNKLLRTNNFSGDTLQGPSVYYDSASGEKIAEGNFINDYKSGEWLYYKNGYLTSKNHCNGPDTSHISFESYDTITHTLFNTGSYTNRKKSGLWTTHINGHLAGIHSYKDDVPDGDFKMYDTVTNRIFIEGQYTAGEKTGIWKTYYKSNGTIKYRDTFIARGICNSETYDSLSGKRISKSRHDYTTGTASYTYYFPNTNIIRAQTTLVSGNLNGPAVYYDLDSKSKRSEGIYKDDKYTGKWTFYYLKTGKLKSTEFYDNGTLEGPFSFYDSISHKKITDGWYKNGEKDSTWTRYDATSGKTTAQETYQAGKYNGEVIKYDRSGTVHSRENYEHGLKQGKSIVYYPNTTTPEIKANYKDAVKDGEQTDYYEDGKLRRTEFFQDGKMTQGKCFKPDGTETDYFPHDEAASFPGDIDAYSDAYLTYPHPALVAKKEGLVRISFKVDTDGSLSDIKILHGIGGTCDEAVMSFMAEMPKWNPAKTEGKPHESVSSLLIRFRASTGIIHVTPLPEAEE